MPTTYPSAHPLRLEPTETLPKTRAPKAPGIRLVRSAGKFLTPRRAGEKAVWRRGQTHRSLVASGVS
jgi:hypothetical protein